MSACFGSNNSLFIFTTQRSLNFESLENLKVLTLEHDRDIRLTRTQTSAVSEHANETRALPIWRAVRFNDRDLHWYTRRVPTTLYPNNINIDRGIVIEYPRSKSTTAKKGDL